VGGSRIGEGEVSHWAEAIDRGALVGGASRQASGTPRQQALAFLISAHWVLGEAAERGLQIEHQAVERRLQALRQAVPGGPDRFAAALEEVGQTTADAELEARVEVAAALLRAQLERTRGRGGTRAELLAYYHSQRKHFVVPERRRIEIVDGIPSRAKARSLARRAGSAAGIRPISFSETRLRPQSFDAPWGKGAVERAIFSARPGVLYGPMPLNGAYVLFAVKRILPATVRPFAAVRGSLEAELTARSRRAAIGAWKASYRAKWKARTDCRSGFVVPECRQYSGPVAAGEDPLSPA
jgi:foldase protein PrsA